MGSQSGEPIPEGIDMDTFGIKSFILWINPEYRKRVNAWAETSPALIALRVATERNRGET